MSFHYRKIDSAMPKNIRWDVPRQNQGQIVEIAYSDGDKVGQASAEAGHGSAWMRVTDQGEPVGSQGRVRYYQSTDDNAED